jgi:beta-lactam-binding protein with PASTA domain
MVIVPNLINKSVDQAVTTLKNLGLNIKVTGKGTAYKQSYKAGTQVPRGGLVQVDFMDPDEVDLE